MSEFETERWEQGKWGRDLHTQPPARWWADESPEPEWSGGCHGSGERNPRLGKGWSRIRESEVAKWVS